MSDLETGRAPEGEAPGAIDAFKNSLLEKRSKAIRARNSIEARWMEDLRVYGRDRDATNGKISVLEAALGERPTSGNTEQAQGRSTLYINIIRSKTNAAEARLSDLLFPVDDRNWGVKPTPVPELTKAASDRQTLMVDQGQPMVEEDPANPGQMRQLTLADMAERTMKEAAERCKAMQSEIDDKLNECGYNGECRNVIHDAAVLGVGILKGPMVVGATKKAWVPGPDGTHTLSIEEELRPASVRVDPWNFYPAEDCGEDPHDGSHVFERKFLSPKKARDLLKLSGVNEPALRRAIASGAKRVTQDNAADVQSRQEAGYSLADANYFELWIYTGDASIEELQACGCDVAKYAPEFAGEDGEPDPLKSVSCNVWILNDEVIKASINVLDTGEFPYDVFVWERVEGSWAGQGIPRLSQSSNRMFQASIRSMMENAGQTVGPQVVINQSNIEPADGDWVIRGRKLWKFGAKDPNMRIDQAFGVFEVPNHQAEYQAIAQLALKFIDDESNFPMLAQGEKGTAPDTVGGMQLLMNSANVVLRRLVKQWDDRITRPHITRYYDWMMQYSPRADIKGDMNVDARGSGALLERDQQNQYIMQAMGLVAHPIFGPMLKPMEILKLGFQALKLPSEDTILPENEYQAEMQRRAKAAQQLPPAEQAKVDIAKMNDSTKREIAAMQNEGAEAERAARVQETLAKIEADKTLTLEQIRAELANLVISTRAESDLYNREQALKLQTGQGI